MPGITISLMNVTLTSSQLAIQLTNGAFALDSGGGVSIGGELAFESVNVTNGAISLQGQSGARVNLTIHAEIEAGSSESPAIEITGFSGTATIGWPGSAGSQMQQMEPGDPITLSDYAG